MKIELDKIAIWQPILPSSLSSHRHSYGTHYIDENGVDSVAVDRPLTRYAKCYTKDGVAYSLFVRTFETDKTKAEKELDKAAAEISKEEVLQALQVATADTFYYTDKKIGDK